MCEITFGFWLAMSPFIFGHGSEETALWISDLACAGAIIVLACLSFARPLRRAHLALIGVALWLIGSGYLYGGHPAAPAYQNEIFVGLLLILFAIIPNEASKPPLDWRRRYQRIAEQE